MIRTLRITSVVAGLLAVGLLVFFSIYGVKGDREVERLVGLPSVIEQFKADRGRPAATYASPMSRLAQNAEAFAYVINPPPPTKPATPVTGADSLAAIRPSKVSGKFRLIATSFNAADPNLSLAFVEMPTVERRQIWARVGNSIEHWKILEIKDGAIVYGEGQQTQEIAVEERPARISLLDNGEPRPAPVSRTASASTVTEAPSQPPGSGAPAQARGRLSMRPALRPGVIQNGGVVVRPPSGERDMQKLQKIADQLRTLRNKDANDGAFSPEEEKARRDAMEKLVSHVQAVRMSQQEANSLGELGKQLDNVKVQADADTNNPQ